MPPDTPKPPPKPFEEFCLILKELLRDQLPCAVDIEPAKDGTPQLTVRKL